MPLVNRAPVDPVTGKLLVTTTTPTAAWPSLGGMTYHPTTGELAVIDAVPAAGDPYVGGIRFTALGAMYVTSTLPSPIFYVGGLPVSADGRLFMSSGAPVGSVGGWPIGSDGGVSGSGLSPQPIFFAPLTNSLIPTTAGNPTFTFTRATTAYVADNEGILRQSIANEARFQGARRVRNLAATSSQNATGLGWTRTNVTATFGAIGPTGLADANTVTATAGGALVYNNTSGLPPVAVTCSLWIRRRTGTGTVTMFKPDGNTGPDITASLADGTWKRYTSFINPTVANAFIGVVIATSGDALDIAYAQSERVEGQSNQAPSEYVSVGVKTAPYHGNAIDGVAYFATTNGNSVTGNVVTEATGTAIPAATLLGYVAENAATNICLQSQTFDNAAWTKNNAAIAADQIAAPDGTLTADKFTDDATNSFHRIYPTATISFVAGAYTASVYAKAGTLTWLQLFISNATATGWANFNIVTGVVGLVGAGATASVTALPNGWYRCVLSVTAGTASGLLQIQSSNADFAGQNPTYVGTSQTMYLWGAQVETGSDPSSYIPTTTVAVVRNGDLLSYQVVSNIDGALATTYAECYFLWPVRFWQSAIRMSVTGLPTQVYEIGTNLFFLQSASGVVKTVNARTMGAINKSASAWSAATASVCLNGGAVANGAFTAYSTTGAVTVGGNSLENIQGSIRNVKFYNVRIADADLRVMTT